MDIWPSSTIHVSDDKAASGALLPVMIWPDCMDSKKQLAPRLPSVYQTAGPASPECIQRPEHFRVLLLCPPTAVPQRQVVHPVGLCWAPMSFASF